MKTQLADMLWQARTSGNVIEAPDPPRSLDEAYSIQAAVVELLGMKQVGWKVGSTSKEAQAKLGTDEPGAGPLLDGFCYHSGDEVPVHPAHDIFVEAEFAFRLGRDIAFGNAPNHEQLHRCIDSLVPAIEVVGSRLRSGLDGAGRELITADCGANVAFVAGADTRDWQPTGLEDQPVTLEKNQSLVAQGTGSRALGHPLNVLQWLASHCTARNLPLRAGHIVTTGTCTGLVAVAPGDEIMASFPGLGSVSARFVEA